MIALPTIALAMPLPGIPLGRCELMKNSRLVTAGSPLAIVNQSTSPSGTRASAVSAYMTAIAKLLLNRRMRLCLIRGPRKIEDLVGFSYSCPCLGGMHEKQRHHGDRQRDQEEDETDLDQRPLVDITRGFDELVGDDTRQRITRRKTRMRNLGPVADHHRDGDGLRQSASQREDRGAEDPGTRRRQDHAPGCLPPRCAERDGRLAQAAWDCADDVPRHRRQGGKDHDRQHQRRAEQAGLPGHATKERNRGQVVRHRRFDMHECPWGQDIKRPDPVDHARDRREELDACAESAAKALLPWFGKEDRDGYPDRECDGQRDRTGDQGPEDEGKRPERVRDLVPVLADQKAESEPGHRRPCLLYEDGDDEDQRRRRCPADERGERSVAVWRPGDRGYWERGPTAAGGPVDAEGPDQVLLRDRLRLVGLGLGATEHRVYSCQDLANREGLRDVVVGAQLEPDDLVDLGVLGRDDDDRHAAALAKRAAEVEAAHARQHQVEEDEIRTGGAGSAQTRGTVRGLLDGEARGGEVVLQHVADALVVFNDQNATRVGGGAAHPSSTTWPVSRNTMSSATLVTRSAMRSRLWATRSKVTARRAPSESVLPVPISEISSSNTRW